MFWRQICFFHNPFLVLLVEKETPTNLNAILQSICCGALQRVELHASFRKHGFAKRNYKHVGKFEAVKEEKATNERTRRSILQRSNAKHHWYLI